MRRRSSSMQRRARACSNSGREAKLTARKAELEHAALAQWLTQQLLLVRGGARARAAAARLATADGALGAGGSVRDAAAADPTAADAAARAQQIE